MSKLSPQTKSAIILFCVAIVGAYLCMMLWADSGSAPKGFSPVPQKTTTPIAQAKLEIPPVDTSEWKTYKDTTYNFSFKHPVNWKVLPIKEKDGYKILEIDPGKKYYNIKIFISPKNYYDMAGLPTAEESIGGTTAINASNMLFGIKNNNFFFTFDLGWSLSLMPDFNALVRSVTFTN